MPVYNAPLHPATLCCREKHLSDGTIVTSLVLGNNSVSPHSVEDQCLSVLMIVTQQGNEKGYVNVGERTRHFSGITVNDNGSPAPYNFDIMSSKSSITPFSFPLCPLPIPLLGMGVDACRRCQCL